MDNNKINEEIAQIIGEGDFHFIVRWGLFYRPEAKGYTGNKSEAWRLPLAEAKKHVTCCDTDRVGIQKCPPRDFCGSHDAMAIAKKWIPTKSGLQLHFLANLCRIVRRDGGDGPEAALPFFASPKQEAEAFLNVFQE